MKRASKLIEQIADPDNLRLAFWKASKGKRYAHSIREYGNDLGNQIVTLRSQILSGKVKVGNYRFFKIYEPKERQICASAFSEQVLHHSIMNICHPFFERVQIHDSYACRIGKGTYAAIDRAKQFSQKSPWFLKLDVKKYFQNIHHDVLKKQLRRMFKDQHLLYMLDQIIDSYEAFPDRGLPIGNLTSQYFANHYLSGLDHYIGERLKIGSHVRYMDDMVLWAQEKSILKAAKSQIEDYIERELRCELKPELLNQSKLGLPFLGYRVFPYHLRLAQKSKQRFVRKMRIVTDNYDSGVWEEATCQRRSLPLLAFVQKADSRKFLQQLNL